jgi:Flp pilus assembly protein TadG
MTRKRRQRGQSIIELAIATPILLTLILGGFTVGTLISDRVIGGYACRQGARLASVLGGSQTNSTPTAQVDANIVKNVQAVARGLNYATVTEIDIYSPSRADGQYTAGDPVDRYDGNGNLIGSVGLPMTNRNQTPPSETSIGVRLVWQFTPATAYMTLNIQMSEYAVLKLSPNLT